MGICRVMIFREQHEKLKKALEELRQKERKVKRWGARIRRTGKSRARFCDDNKIAQESFCRWITGKKEPDFKSIEQVETALEKEQV